jgi:hypothetical protein
MAQMKVGTYTNPSSGTAATNISFGFTVDSITVYNVTAGSIFSWNSSMDDASYFTVTSGAYTSSNGFTPLAQSTAVGATISNITAANPAVITVNDTSTFGFAAGDTILVTEVADDLTGTTLNAEYTIASVTATTITTATDTSSGYSAYVSGGLVTRVSDTNGDAIPIQNQAIRGLTFGTGVVGANSDVVTYVAFGSNSVV